MAQSEDAVNENIDLDEADLDLAEVEAEHEAAVGRILFGARREAESLKGNGMVASAAAYWRKRFADARREQRAAQQLGQVVVGEEGAHHARVVFASRLQKMANEGSTACLPA